MGLSVLAARVVAALVVACRHADAGHRVAAGFAWLCRGGNRAWLIMVFALIVATLTSPGILVDDAEVAFAGSTRWRDGVAAGLRGVAWTLAAAMWVRWRPWSPPGERVFA
jgi:hypothetical protein